MTVRPAVVADAEAVAEIYNQAIEERTATFRTEPWLPDDIRGWVEASDRPPFIVAQRDGRVDGWARVVPYSDADFYAGVGEYTLYVRREARREGVGRELLLALGDEARRRGYFKLVGKLFSDNEPSIALAHACGFRDVGIHHRHGRLDGEWRDVLVNEWLLDEP